jgi:UDP-N-acetylmuramoyl-tripeptide--D-alanyl-D-alanine ligase
MAELGDRADEEHRGVGVAAAENGVDILVGIGEEGARMAAGADTVTGSRMERHVAADAAEAAALLRRFATPRDLILLKGSRSTRMEKVLTHLNEGS